MLLIHLLAELILNNENYILNSTLAYAKKNNYLEKAATLIEAWEVSIRGLSDALVTALNTYNEVPELNLDEGFALDQITAFGILEARHHRYRGINLDMFLGLMKYYRQAYLDLVIDADLPKLTKCNYALFIIRFFDRVELGFIKEWTNESKDILIENLQITNRNITNEKNKFLTIIESLPTSIIILNKDNLIDYLNNAALEFLRGTAAPGADYYTGNYIRRGIEIFPWFEKELDAFLGGTNTTVKFDKEINYRKKDKKTIGIVFTRMFDVSKQLKGTIITISDITKRIQMENAIRRLDRLYLVGEMAASLGHEIRNPMTTVRGFLQMFMDDYAKDKEALELMIEELDRANAIITEYLSLAWDKLVELKLINLNSIIIKILPLLNAHAMAQGKNVIIDIEDIPDLLLDEKEIRQLIFNLVRNGLESMSSGGNVTIKTYMENGNVVLSVKDEGHGINPEILEKLGTPFITTKEGGTGLGLAICYGIALRHNANITVQTGKTGTTFLINFSLTKAIKNNY